MENISDYIEPKRQYSILAEIYDAVMHDVDYEAWADYIDEVIMRHHHEARDILELACGTGTMAISMEELGYYTITATDLSPDMIRKAREKGEEKESDVSFQTLDFLDINLDKKFDAVYMVFDSLNYLHNTSDIAKLHEQVYNVLNPGGIFVYDFTTPRNSRKAIRYLDNENETVNEYFSYQRSSRYDEKQKIHTNTFDISLKNLADSSQVKNYREEHQQRIYTMNELYPIVEKSPFSLVKAYDGFELKPAHKRSLRITMVLR
ncbi:class I SAM-dependent methyltransferase [Rhodohalobacter sp. SW132]|uniref:class I SAM-dependent DNA methyltransferase n=1 Tax=Rhodohalobacter sp. SW132 TaxID=2293433 RepID=UPI000E283755|nr:class I SAM-dependent methyltransferase [Rhodohalobacter sp. SW132]REL33646.1 class I SAM-dependent methyltransferase [Rhodohalobacter sp. SW132]